MRMLAWVGLAAGMIFRCCPVGAQSSEKYQGAFADSLRVERWLAEAPFLPADSCRTLYFAHRLLGVPYVAGTLEGGKEEHLVCRTDAVDCVTFVETVLALTLADSRDNRSFADFKRYLQLLRYRDGQVKGYASRLHYFTDWVKDNERKGLVRECTAAVADTIQKLCLNFMTDHVSAYPVLKNHPEEVKEIARCEQLYQNLDIPFVQKSSLNKAPDQLKIQNGDVLAIVTNIKGLDVVHMGFACWMNGKLHLLHASSNKKKVILDPLPLHDYSSTKQSQIGIRVVKVLK